MFAGCTTALISRKLNEPTISVQENTKKLLMFKTKTALPANADICTTVIVFCGIKQPLPANAGRGQIRFVKPW
jgi:hypothetical protein